MGLHSESAFLAQQICKLAQYFVTGQAYLCQSIMLIMTHTSDVLAKNTSTHNLTACLLCVTHAHACMHGMLLAHYLTIKSGISLCVSFTQSRRTDDPSDPDRSQSFSLSSRPGPGQMPQQDLPAPVRHLVKDPALQAMAAEAASKVADAVR